jgi:cell division septum initiation protein DivIVA
MHTTMRPTVIVARRFLRTRSRGLAQGVSAAAAALTRALLICAAGIRARLIVFASLQEAAGKVADLQHQVAAAQQQVAAYREQERLLARATHLATQAARELTEAARMSAEETALRARSAAGEIITTAQEAAAATLREAREEADETLRAARAWADATLGSTRTTAQRDVDAIGDDAAARIEQLVTAADRLADDARTMVREMEGRIQTAAADLQAKATAFETQRDEHAQGLAALIERHAETLAQVTHIQADVQERLVPALTRLTAGLQGAGTSVPRAPLGKTGRRRGKGAGAPEEEPPPEIAPPVNGETAPPLHTPGEVVVKHVISFRQATRVVRALSRAGGVDTVRLRTYAGGVATIDVTIDRPLDALDVAHLDGLAAEVVEATTTRLVLRLGIPSYSALPT